MRRCQRRTQMSRRAILRSLRELSQPAHHGRSHMTGAPLDGNHRVLLDQEPRPVGLHHLVPPDDHIRPRRVPRESETDRCVRHRLEDESIGLDVAAVDVRVAIVVHHRGTVLAVPRCPSRDPVELPGEDVRPIVEELVLLEVTREPAPVLDRLECGPADSIHRGRSRTHTALVDPTLPRAIGIEATQRVHLGTGLDRLGDEVYACVDDHLHPPSSHRARSDETALWSSMNRATSRSSSAWAPSSMWPPRSTVMSWASGIRCDIATALAYGGPGSSRACRISVGTPTRVMSIRFTWGFDT